MLSGEATNTNFKVFGLTQQQLKTMIYHTKGEHANHYITYAIILVIEKRSLCRLWSKAIYTKTDYLKGKYFLSTECSKIYMQYALRTLLLAFLPHYGQLSKPKIVNSIFLGNI
jgi:hypothetical protein